jgi:hypothetical protein
MDVDGAFQILRRAARSNRMKLHDLALDVVGSSRTPRAVELELVRGRRVKQPFPAPASDRVH